MFNPSVKRFTDTNKWNDAWFMNLPPKLKCAWWVLVDTCDHAGIVDENLKLLSFLVGVPIERDELLNSMQGRVIEFKPGKWFIKPFIKFQYGIELNPENSAHQGVIKKLKEHGLDCPVSIKQGASKGLARGCEAPKDKDKDKDKEQIPPDPLDASNYGQSIGMLEDEINAFMDHHSANGWRLKAGKMKDWKAALRTWHRNGKRFGTVNGHSNGTLRPIDKSILQKEKDLIVARLTTLRNQYDPHMTWSDRDKTEASKLKPRLLEINNQLGCLL